MTTAQHYSWSKMNGDSPMDKALRKRVIGQQMMVSHVTLQPGCLVPTHDHENEQICCVLSGRIRFEIGEADSRSKDVVVVSSGEVLLLPSNVPHSAYIEEETVVLDLFSPPSATTGIDQHKEHTRG